MIAVPLLLLLLLTVVQFAVAEHARHVAHAVAAHAVTTARLPDATAADGETAGRTLLHQLGTTLTGAVVTVRRDADRVTATVTGTAETVVPGMRLPIRATSNAPVERLQPAPGERMRPMRQRPVPRPDENGSSAIELTLLTPLLLVLLLFVVAAGRITSARLAVQDAAHAAARTLTLTSGVPGTANATASAAASAATHEVPCQHLTVSITDPSAPTAADAVTPGAIRSAVQIVTVQVTCTVNLADLTGLALPTTTTITATATSPLDRYRSQP